MAEINIKKMTQNVAEKAIQELRDNGVFIGIWIPVSERKPKAGEYVGDVDKYYLVQNEYGDMLVARYTHGEYWEQIFQFKPICDEIVAWMPLPPCYVPQENEKWVNLAEEIIPILDQQGE